MLRSLAQALTPRPPDPPPPGQPVPVVPTLTPRLVMGMAGAILATFISYLDTRLTTYSLADLRGGFSVGVDEASWVSNAYNIAEIAIVPITPWIASIITARRAIVIATIVLNLAAAAVPTFPDSYTTTVALRFLQGLGGGALIPLLLSTLLRFMPLHHRPIGFACYALVTTATPLIAESVSGLLTEAVAWQAVFYLGALIGPIVIIMVMVGLPTEPIKPEGFVNADYLGMFLMALFASTLTAALDVGQRLDWLDSPLIVQLFIASALLFVAWVVREATAEHPLIDLKLLAGRNIICGLLMIFPFSLQVLVTANIVPQFGTVVRGFRELQIGDVLIRAAILQIFACAAAPFLYRRIDARLMLCLGLSLTVLGCRLGTYIDSDWVLADLEPSTLLVACGQPLIMVGLLLFATSKHRPQDALAGGTLFNVVRTLAGSIGGAIVVGVQTVRERVHSNTIADHVVAGTLGGVPPAQLAARTTVQATVMATSDAYGMLGVIAIGGMFIALMTNEIRIARAPAA
jgi:DHA2 family multidrug resistance protein